MAFALGLGFALAFVEEVVDRLSVGSPGGFFPPPPAPWEPDPPPLRGASPSWPLPSHVPSWHPPQVVVVEPRMSVLDFVVRVRVAPSVGGGVAAGGFAMDECAPRVELAASTGNVTGSEASESLSI